jgi:hypothetical protein
MGQSPCLGNFETLVNENLFVPYLLLFLIKLFQLQLFDVCSIGTVFGRLNRSKSAGVGGEGTDFFFVAVDGRCSDDIGGGVDRCRIYEECGRANVSCRRLASVEQAAHGRNSRLSCKCANERSFLI